MAVVQPRRLVWSSPTMVGYGGFTGGWQAKLEVGLLSLMNAAVWPARSGRRRRANT